MSSRSEGSIISDESQAERDSIDSSKDVQN